MTQRRFTIPTPLGWHACNPSIAAADDGFRMLVRVVNYEISPDARYITSDGDGVRNAYKMLSLRPDFSVRWEVALDDQQETPWGCVFYRPDGYEDLRLTYDDADWLAVGASRSWNEAGLCQTFLLRIVDNALRRPRVVGASSERHQKNWMPAVAPCGLLLIESCGPTRVVSLNHNDDEFLFHDAPRRAERFRGGSQAIPFDSGWLAVVHEIALRMDGRRIYRHRWVWFDADWRLTRWSKPFSFRGEDFEFCAGLAPMGSDAIVASFGVWDREVWLDVRPLDDVRASLHPGTRYAEATCCSPS